MAQMTETKIAGVEPKNTASECCDPACGPDTCGSEQVVQIETAQSNQVKAQAGDCCDPGCGPGTCG